MATTVITDETVTISLRMGATLALSAISTGTADAVYTLPGEAERTDAVAGTVVRNYGPYPFGVDFAITATGSVQADTVFDTVTADAAIQQVDTLPSAGEPNLIYQTADAAYWWNGVEFIPMGSGAGGDFTALTASGLFKLTGVEASVTAFAGGGKASATPLSATKNFHRISVCATAADSVLLPAATVGQMHFLRNDGAAAAQVFGAGTDTINAVATATGVSLAPGSGVLFFCLSAGAWVTSVLTTVLGPVGVSTLSASGLVTLANGVGVEFIAGGATLRRNGSTGAIELVTMGGSDLTVESGARIFSTTAIPAGGSAGMGFKASSTADFGVFYGSGAPTLAAAQGSLYLRSDGSGVGDRAYINTDGADTWTALTTAA